MAKTKAQLEKERNQAIKAARESRRNKKPSKKKKQDYRSSEAGPGIKYPWDMTWKDKTGNTAKKKPAKPRKTSTKKPR